MPAKLIVAHSYPIFREILSNILQRQSGLQVVAQAATAAELLQATITHQPDIIITDVALNGMEGFTLKRLAVCRRQAKIIISWQYKDEAAMGAALAANYAGYISHDATPRRIFPGYKRNYERQCVSLLPHTKIKGPASFAGSGRCRPAKNSYREICAACLLVTFLKFFFILI